MGWYAFISLAQDGRIKFLLVFIFVAVGIASVLTFVEFRLNKRKKAHEERSNEQSLVDYLNRSSMSNNTPVEKLKILDYSVKVYFRDAFGFKLSNSYSELIKLFEQRGKNNLAKFCNEIFEAHYSPNEISELKVKELFSSFERIVRSSKKKIEDVKDYKNGFNKIGNKFSVLTNYFSRNLKIIKSKRISRKVESNVRKNARENARVASLNDKVQQRVFKIQEKEDKKKTKIELNNKYKLVRIAYAKKKGVEKIQRKNNRRKVVNNLKKEAVIQMFNGVRFVRKKKINFKRRIEKSRDLRKISKERKKILAEKKELFRLNARKIEERERAHLRHGVLLKKLSRKKEKEEKRRQRKETKERKKKLKKANKLKILARKDILKKQKIAIKEEQKRVRNLRKEQKRKEKKAKRLKILARKTILKRRAVAVKGERKRVRNLEKERKIFLILEKKKKKKIAREKERRIKEAREKILTDEARYKKEQISKEKRVKSEQKRKEKEAKKKLKILLKRQRKARADELKTEKQRNLLENKRIRQIKLNEIRISRAKVIKSEKSFEKREINSKKKLGFLLKKSKLLDLTQGKSERSIQSEILKDEKQLGKKNNFWAFDLFKKIKKRNGQRKIARDLSRKKKLAEKIRKRNIIQKAKQNKKIEIQRKREQATAFKLAQKKLKDFDKNKQKEIRQKIKLAGILKRKRVRDQRKLDRKKEKLLKKERKRKEKALRIQKREEAKTLKKELLEVRKKALEKRKRELGVQNKLSAAKKLGAKRDSYLKSKLLREKNKKMKDIASRRQKIIKIYPIGSLEWMKELDRNSRK